MAELSQSAPAPALEDYSTRVTKRKLEEAIQSLDASLKHVTTPVTASNKKRRAMCVPVMSALRADLSPLQTIRFGHFHPAVALSAAYQSLYSTSDQHTTILHSLIAAITPCPTGHLPFDQLLPPQTAIAPSTFPRITRMAIDWTRS